MQRVGQDRYVFSASDLMHFLGCHHCVYLDLKGFTEQLDKDTTSESDLLLRAKGIDHEKAYLEELRLSSGPVTDIPRRMDREQRRQLTLEAMRSGAPIIYQAALEDGLWAGDADFLLRVDRV